MPGALQTAGPVGSANPLRADRMFTGLWTNRISLRDAASSSADGRYSGVSRLEALWAGVNAEVTSKLSLARRAGSTAYNTSSFPPINRLYPFRSFDATTENIRLIADTDLTVYDATGPSTKLALFTKTSPVACTFLSVGNSLYFTNGTDGKKWLVSARPWQAGAVYAEGDYILAGGMIYQATTAGTSASTIPAFPLTWGATVVDGTVTWTNRGGAVVDWSPQAPPTAPTISQVAIPTTYASWSPRNYYSTSFLVVNAAGYLHKVTTFGTTGTAEPTWNNTGSTTDGTVTWTAQGLAARLPNTAYATGAYIQANDALGNPYFFQCTAAGTTAAAAPTFPAALSATISDGTAQWTNVGIKATWQDVTSSSLRNNFAEIPLKGGGTLILGAGTGAQGTQIALPTGYTTANMLVWTTPGQPLGGPQVSGVQQSSGTNGQLSSVWQNRSGAAAFTSDSQWVAAAWSANANVVVSASNGVTYVTLTTAAGQPLCLAVGQLAEGATVAAPAGFSAANSISIAGMSGSTNGTLGTQALICSLDSSLKLTAHYRDGSLNTAAGLANVFVAFYGSGAPQSITGGNAILIPTSGLGQIALMQFIANNGASFGLPAGFNRFSAALSIRDQKDAAGDSVAHGISSLGYSGTTVGAAMGDGQGGLWGMVANGFGVAIYQAQTTISPNQVIEDTNGGLQTVTLSGVSGSVAPPWQSLKNGVTADNSTAWTLTGITQIGWTAPAQYVYDYQSAVDLATSNASPPSSPVTLQPNYNGYIQGAYSSDPQVHTVRIFRQLQGGSTYFLLDTFDNVLSGGTWSYTDTSVDTSLNNQIRAAVTLELTPLPAGSVAPSYHLQRVFVAVQNQLYWSVGPDGVSYGANGATGFPPANVFVYPSRITRTEACSLGLLVFTVSDLYIVQGTGTASDPLYTVPFIAGLGLLNYNALAVQKSTYHLISSDRTLATLDAGAGLLDMGLPIADRIAQYVATAGLCFHSQSSMDTGLYAWDGTTGWYRLAPNVAPEQGQAWSPQAQISGGCRYAASIEIEPGVRRLLYHQTAGGPILMRDATSNTDNGVPFPVNFTFGSIMLAQPSELAELEYITLESANVGTRPTVSVLLGEIAGTFQPLGRTRHDPPLLPASRSLFADRYHFGQNQRPVACRHLQMRVDFPAEDAANELYAFTLVGALRAEQ